jgi:hypothetical protein
MRWYERYMLYALTIFVAFMFVGDLLQSIDRTWSKHPIRVEAPAPKQIYVVLPDGKVIERDTITLDLTKIPKSAFAESLTIWIGSDTSRFFGNAAYDSAQAQAEWKQMMNRRLRRVERDTTQVKQMHAKLDALHKRFETMRDELTKIKKGVKR